MMSEKELRALDARVVNVVNPKEVSEYLGCVWAAYGDWNYYRLNTGEVVCCYFSIGD